MRMLWLWMLGLLLASTVASYAVSYDQGLPINMSVRYSSLSITLGQTVRLTVSASDTDYEVGANDAIRARVDDPVTIAWEAVGGSIRKLNAQNNPVELTWSPPLEPGRYAIIISADDSGRYADDPLARQVIEVEVKRTGFAYVPSVRVAATPQTIRLDRSRNSVITAQVLDEKPAGKAVRFYTTRGSLSATTATTDANGTATVRLTATDRDLGTATVIAYYKDTASSTTVEIVTRTPRPEPYEPVPPTPLPPTANPPGFLVSVEPATLPADGQSTAVVSVRLTDLRGLGIPKQIVIFRSTLGGIQPMRSMTDAYGYARVQLIAPTTPGTAMIVAETGAQTGYATAAFTAQQAQETGPPRLFLSVDPTTMLADGVSKVTVEALVLDSGSHAVVNTPVVFSSSLGKLKDATVNTGQDGRAVTTLTAPDRPGLGRVAAQIGQVIAASQITFQGIDTSTGPALDIQGWSGQRTGFVAGNWMLRQMQAEMGTQSAASQNLIILDANAKVTKEVALGVSSVLIRDQYGAARGYTVEDHEKAQLVLLKQDGTASRTVTMNLPLGSHVVDARYAEPAGHLLVSLSRPDGTAPEVQLISAGNEPLQVFRDGLEKIPVMALGGDGYLAVAFPGGTVRLYGPNGVRVSEGTRKDGMPATLTAVGPGGVWYAVASAVTGGDAEVQPKVTVFSGQGVQLAAFDLHAYAMTPINANALAVSTPDRTVNVNLVARRIDWSLAGGFERFLATNDYGVIGGQRDEKTGALLSRILVVRLSDGKLAAMQDFADFGGVTAILPPDDKGLVSAITGAFTLRFPLVAKT